MIKDKDEPIDYKKAFELSPIILGISTLKEGKYIEVNRQFLESLNCKRGEVIGKTSKELGLFIDYDMRDIIVSGLKKDGFVNDIELQIKTKSGEVRTALFSAEMLDKESFLASVKDITILKEAEETLRESEDKFKFVFEQSLVGKTLSHISGKIEINQAFCDMIGYTIDQVKKLKWQGLTHPDDIELTQKNLDMLLSGEKHSVQFTKRYIHRDGSVVWTDMYAVLRRDDNDKPLYYVTTIIDITERMKMEELLKESESQFRQMFEKMMNCVAIYNVRNNGKDFIISDFNPAAEKIENVRKEDILGKNVLDVFPSVVEFGLYDVFQRVWNTGKPEFFPLKLYEDKRISGWKENYVFKLPNGNIVALYEDVTDIKKNEETIQSKAALLDALINSTADGILIVDTSGKKILQNQRCIDLWGIPEEIALNNDDSQQLEFVKNRTVDPVKFVEKAVYLYSHPDEISHDEVAFKDGMILERYSAPISSHDGKNYGRIWTFHDVTEKKKSENMLKSKIEEFERFNKFAIDRELKMVELKEQIKKLKNGL